MIPDPRFSGGLLKDTLCFIGDIPCLEDLSTLPGHWIVTRPGMDRAAKLVSFGVIKNWLSCPSSSAFLDRVTEGIDEEDNEVRW